MIDTHCHLDLPAFDQDRRQVLQRCRQAGVRHLLVPGIDLQGFPGLTAIREPTIHIALGLHPLFLSHHPADAPSQLENWIERSKPTAIGEIGLDYREPENSRIQQLALFESQLKLGKKYSLPLLLHVIKAHDETLALLRRFSYPFGGIVHGFNGSRQQAQQYLDLGFLLGFGGVVTYERAKKIRRIAADLPDSALVLESDAPDLPPAGFTNERNEPGYLPIVVETLARLRQVSPEHIINMTSINAKALLGFDHDT
jgi:TatD DNase family protein